MKLRRAIACLLGLLLVLQPAFASVLPRCSHGGEHAAAAAHAGHHGMAHAGGHHDRAPKHCDCGCGGAMAGCAHAGASVAITARIGVPPRVSAASAPRARHEPAHSSIRSDPPLRPPTHA